MKISEFATRQIRRNINQIRRHAGAVRADRHPEAIHDFRVAVRRLRSFLQTLKEVYGKYPVSALLIELKNVASVTNRLRDIEVASQILRSLEISPENVDEFKKFLTNLAEEEKIERKSIQELMNHKDFLMPLKKIQGLLLIPLAEKRDPEFSTFAQSKIEMSRKRVSSGRRKISQNIDNAHWLHGLRIKAKKTRYIAEDYKNALPREIIRSKASIQAAKTSRQLQQVLGDIHDCDVMIQMLEEESTISLSLLEELKQHIQLLRRRHSAKLQRIQPEDTPPIETANNPA